MKKTFLISLLSLLTVPVMAAIFLVPQCPSGGGWTNQLRKEVNDLLNLYIIARKE